MREEVHEPEEHDFVPAEDGFGMVEKIMWLLAVGVDGSALEEVFGVREITIRSWLCRSGMQGRKLHERFVVELDLIHVQLDELHRHWWLTVWGKTLRLRICGLWAVGDVKTKMVVVLQVGDEPRKWLTVSCMN